MTLRWILIKNRPLFGLSRGRLKLSSTKSAEMFQLDLLVVGFGWRHCQRGRAAVAPTVTVQNQIVAVPLKTNVTLECLVESSPKSVYFWYKDGRHQMQNRIVSTAGGSLTLRSCRP